MSYTTPALIQQELRATTEFSTTTTPTLATVKVWIEEASRVIDDIASTRFEPTQYVEYLDIDESTRYQLRNSPIITVDSLKYNTATLGSTAVWETKTENTHFITFKKYGEVMFIPNIFTPKEGYQNVEVTYTAGFEVIPAKVQMLTTKMVANRILSSLIGNNVNEGNDGGSISVGSISIVEPASYGVNSYKQLKTDIEDLKKELISGFSVLRY